VPLLALALLLALPSPVPPSGLRLGASVRPLREAVDLRIVPSAERFSGTVDIDLELREATSTVWLNGTGLEVSAARLEFSRRSQAARVVLAEDRLGFSFDRAVGPGKARLHVEYRGSLSDTATEGLFRRRDGDEWYAFSQFEPIDARRAFPSFDEPSFKIQWRLTLHVRDGDVAVSNMPVVGTVSEKDGLKRVDFAETPPLPSYLLAVGVGPFEIVDAGVAGRKRTPIRILTARGRTGEAAWAAAATPRLLERLEEYFDLPYPYDKLDQLALPVMVAFGAMENAGLITYADGLLLRKPEEESVGFRRFYADVCAHELAHQWFGDLVTLAWWDDVWLNESLASWMGSKVIEGWKPQWSGGAARVASRREAMQQDRLAGARRIRQPIASKHDIVDAFDSITYVKGEAVVRMFESWLGEDVFRKGVQRYLGRHAWGNATTADFLAALSAKAGRDVAPAFSTFLDQSGIPLVSVELVCAPGGAPLLRLRQEPYRPLGSRPPSRPTWQVPVCTRPGQEGKAGRACTLLAEATGELTLGGAACPDLVEANDGEVGYYLTRYPPELLRPLLATGGRGLTAAERVGFLGSVEALALSGALPAGEALSLLPAAARDPDRYVVETAIAVARSLGSPLRGEGSRPLYARFLRDAFGERAHGLGWKIRPGDDEDTQFLRRSLLSLAAVEGEDEGLGAEALALARRWLSEPAALDRDMAGVVLLAAARRGDPALFEQFRAAALAATDRERRRELLRALGAFRDPMLLESALSLTLGEGVDPRESIEIVWSAAQGAETRAAAYDFVKAHFEALTARLPPELSALLPHAGASLCTAAAAAELESFFRPRVGDFPGGPRVLDAVVEQVQLCDAFRSAQQASALSFLSGRAGR
jgi:alanyl aminopeptidase